MGFWKIMRVLVTNCCNYNCIYCHNEGQEEHGKDTMSFENFVKIFDVIKQSDIKEIRFSGGEPLVNKKTIDMVEYVNYNSDLEIGIATNGSLISEEIACRLSKTRTLVTLHFPAYEQESYNRITKGDYLKFLDAVELLEKYKVPFSYNYVLYPEEIDNLESVLDSEIVRNKRIKLLPYIEENFNNYSAEILQELIERFDSKYNRVDGYGAGEEIYAWITPNNTKIKMIKSPCYSKNIMSCKCYGEVRLLPSLELQKCIFDKQKYRIRMDNRAEITNMLQEMWDDFSYCYRERK